MDGPFYFPRSSGKIKRVSKGPYRVQYRHTWYVVFQNIVIIAVLTMDLFSPSQVLSVHVCKGLEFRVRFEVFYGNDHGKRKHIHH